MEREKFIPERRRLEKEKLDAIANLYADYRTASNKDISLTEFMNMLEERELDWSDVVEFAAEAGKWDTQLKNLRGE